MSLAILPSELLMAICGHLSDESLNCLAKISKKHSALLFPQLYDRIITIRSDENGHEWFLTRERLKPYFSSLSSGFLVQYFEEKTLQWAISATFPGRHTWLHIFAEAGNTKLVDIFLSKGVDIESRSKFGWTALHCAAVYGHLDVVRQLVTAGANVISTTDRIETPLMLAAMNDQFNTTMFFIEVYKSFNLNIHTPNDVDEHPLYQAAAYSSPELIERLIFNGGDLFHESTCNLLPLHGAIYHDNEETQLFLINLMEHVPERLSSRTELLDELFDTALSRRRWRAAERLLDLGANIEKQHRRGQTADGNTISSTPMDVIISLGTIKAVPLFEKMKEFGPTKWPCDGLQEELWHHTRHGHLAPIKFILDLRKSGKVDFDFEDNAPLFGNSSLMYQLLIFAGFGEYGTAFEIAEMLVEAGVPCDRITSKNCETPLHAALAPYHFTKSDNTLKSLKIAQLFIPRVSDLSHQNPYGNTVLHYAAKSRCVSAIEALLPRVDTNTMKLRDVKGSTAMHEAVLSGCPRSVELFLQHESGPKIMNLRSNSGSTPLHEAARAGRDDILKIIVDAGCDVNIPEKRGRTALHIAATKPNVASLKSLVDAGAKLFAGDVDGYAPLHFALESQLEENVSFLSQAGAEYCRAGCSACTARKFLLETSKLGEEGENIDDMMYSMFLED